MNMKKISIVIPAYNEEGRIKQTLERYLDFFEKLRQENTMDFEFVVVLNGCKDNTLAVVQETCNHSAKCFIVNLPHAGKGLAVKEGFSDALTRDADLIGFVDADMATSPEAFYDLVTKVNNHAGIIASRYMKESRIFPPRPWLKEWGRRIIYRPLVALLFGMTYKDLQCGAKLFTRSTVATVTPHMQMQQWAFDVELLYLCKRFGFPIKELPTVWYDKTDSKLRLVGAGSQMLTSLLKLRLQYSPFRRLVSA